MNNSCSKLFAWSLNSVGNSRQKQILTLVQLPAISTIAIHRPIHYQPMPKMTITFSALALYFGFLVSLVAFSVAIKGLPKVKAGGATKPRSSPFAKWRDSNPAGDKTRVDIIMFGAKQKWDLTFSFLLESYLERCMCSQQICHNLSTELSLSTEINILPIRHCSLCHKQSVFKSLVIRCKTPSSS